MSYTSRLVCIVAAFVATATLTAAASAPSDPGAPAALIAFA